MFSSLFVPPFLSVDDSKAVAFDAFGLFVLCSNRLFVVSEYDCSLHLGGIALKSCFACVKSVEYISVLVFRSCSLPVYSIIISRSY